MYLNSIGHVANLLIGGWQANGIVTYADGTPVILQGIDNGTTAESIFTFSQRPAWTGKDANLSNHTVNKWFDTAQFSKPAAFTIGNAPRTLPNVRNPSYDNLDASLVKNNKWGSSDQYDAQFRLEMFNAFNHPILGGPDTNINDSTFGQITPGNYANSARQIPLGFKFYY